MSTNWREQAPIKSERLLLRKMELSDAQDMFEFLSIPSVGLYTTHAPAQHLSDATSFIEARREGPQTYNFAVTLAPATASASTHSSTGGKVIGVLGSKRFPEIGYIFHPVYHGQGYATEALAAFADKLWERMPASLASASSSQEQLTSDEVNDVRGYDYVVAHCDTENRASQRVLEKAGFVRGSVTEKEYVSPQLGERDSVTYWSLRPGKIVKDVIGSLDGKARGCLPAGVATMLKDDNR